MRNFIAAALFGFALMFSLSGMTDTPKQYHQLQLAADDPPPIDPIIPPPPPPIS